MILAFEKLGAESAIRFCKDSLVVIVDAKGNALSILAIGEFNKLKKSLTKQSKNCCDKILVCACLKPIISKTKAEEIVSASPCYTLSTNCALS